MIANAQRWHHCGKSVSDLKLRWERWRWHIPVDINDAEGFGGVGFRSNLGGN